MRPLPGWRVLTTLLGWAVACSSPSQEATQALQTAHPLEERLPLTASADLEPTRGHQAKGAITFQERDSRVRVVAHIRGLQPGEHALSIQESGGCSAADATGIGGHFNPTNSRHGSPQGEEHHAGDLGNVVADEDGYAQVDATFDSLSLSEGPNSIIGRGVIVYAEADDSTTQPAGNAGSRVACGVVVAHQVPTGPREGSGP